MLDDALFESAAQMAQANNYNDWTFSLFAPLVRGRVLEVGCGVGSFTRRIVAAGGFESLLSIDVSPDAVERCRRSLEHPALTFRNARVEDVPDEHDAFDLIVCMNVLEHIEDDRQALAHMLSLLRPSGTLFLLVPAHRFLFTPFDDASGHFRRYDKGHMKKLLLAAAGGAHIQVTQHYFNAVGALGYFVVYKVLRKLPRENAAAEIGLFDKWISPVMRRVEGKRLPFGISLVSVATKS